MPFNLFKYGRTGHFASICTYEERKDSESEEEPTTKYKGSNTNKAEFGKRLKFPKQRKSLYTKEESSSSEEENNRDSSREVLFMELIQDEDSEDGGKLWVKGTCESTSKLSRKCTYNGIYMPPAKSKIEESSTCIEEPSK